MPPPRPTASRPSTTCPPCCAAWRRTSAAWPPAAPSTAATTTADHAGAGGRLPRAGREADLQRDRGSRGDGRQGAREGRLLRHQPQPPLHPGGAAGQALAERGPAGPPALRQHEHVDHEPARELALLSDQGAAPAHRRRHAPLLRRRRGGAVLCHQGAGAQDLVHRHLQHALQERRRRRAHRLLRHRARPPDGALRGRRHRRALRDRRHVARGDALPGRQPREDRLHQPGLRRHA